MRYFAGMTESEIADALGLNRSNDPPRMGESQTVALGGAQKGVRHFMGPAPKFRHRRRKLGRSKPSAGHRSGVARKRTCGVGR